MKHITREQAERLTWRKAHLWGLTEKQQRDLDDFHRARARRFHHMVWAAGAMVVAVVVAQLFGAVLR